MGLLGDSFKAMRMKDPVDGTAQVVGSTQPPDNATSSNVNLTVVVQAEGVPATSVEFSCIAPTKKWPFPGETLPVTVDRADPERIKVRWDDVPESGDVSKAQADALAAQMNQGGGGQGQVVSGDVADMVKALQQQYGAGAAPDQGGDDRVAQLERLTKLKESGALSDAEFEKEKARILGS